NLLFTYSLARKLDGSGASAAVFHPGLVKSKLTKDMPPLMNSIIQMLSGKPDKAAAMLSSLAIDEKYNDTNGKFLNSSGKEIKSSKYSYDQDIQEKLWEVSLEMS